MDLATGIDRDVSAIERWNHMKKFAVIALLLCTCLVVGCGDKKPSGSGSAAPATTGSAS
jgi:hypothetical protein